MNTAILKEGLDRLYDRYNHRRFVDPDPLVFLYDYKDLRDREVAGLVASSLAFGGVRQIMASVGKVLGRKGHTPSSILLEHTAPAMAEIITDIRNRWATGSELAGMLGGIKWTLENYGSVENAFISCSDEGDEDVLPGLAGLAGILYERSPGRIDCLVPAPTRGSACKRLNLFLRWMVREDEVDPGGWNNVSRSKLLIPLDVHMHRFARSLGLTARSQGDMRTAKEVTEGLRTLDREDPVRYDFAISRLGIRRDEDRDIMLSKLGLVSGEKGSIESRYCQGDGTPDSVER